MVFNQTRTLLVVMQPMSGVTTMHTFGHTECYTILGCNTIWRILLEHLPASSRALRSALS